MLEAVSQAPEPVQIAEVLGLPRAATFDDLKLVSSIRDGIPARSAEHAARAIDPEGSQLRAIDLVPKSTLHRCIERNKPLSTDASETLWQVARVYVEARRLYRDGDAALAFLFRPHPLLDGRRPFDLARETTAGSDLVLKVLAQAEAGSAV
ncbi:MAG: antitoxin Xre-like helix-turn-helix domain-containing protein [Hyphomicrobiaceae bacterium]|nr:antitoxin Xre-like helix-turn-helix domain-containing protein [Hyphomicrobiaceae bacterium]